MPVTEMTLDELAVMFDGMAADAAPTSYAVPLKASKLAILASTKENFAGEHAPDGTPWKPLKRKRRNSKGRDRILRDKGLLYSSIATANGPGSMEQIGDTFLEMGTSLEYAPFQHGGTKHIPARPFLGFNDPLVEKIKTIFADWYYRQLTKRLKGS